MSKSMKVKRGDTALVITGKEKGSKGRILHVIPKTEEVIIEGVNMIHKHRKPRSQQDRGGIIKQEGRMKASNVMVVCPHCAKATRVSHKIENGKKVRMCKKCGQEL